MEETDGDDSDVARVLAGDVGAFEGIVRRWEGRLVNLAWRFCRDRDRAEDMAQEAFLNAFRSLRSFRGDSTFSTWLTSIALNTCRSRLRADGPPLLALPSMGAFAVEPSALEGLQDEERAEAVRRAVLTLPARYRDAIVVYYFHGCDVSQTALTLGIAAGTVKANLYRGRELLRRRCASLDPRRAAQAREEV